tara:strand:- start:608 stop:1507 length:900 start_codon:yes stop_codon:yes gene_type:complete
MKTESNEKISIGLGIYNEEKYVGRMIESILSQTYNNFELIISDDCSTDNTNQICKNYEKSDKRVCLFTQDKNLGVVKNLQFLLNKSKYDFFIYLAGDDIISENYLEENLRNLLNNPGASCSAGCHIWEDQDIQKDKICFELNGSLYQRLNYFLSNSFNATAMNYALYRTEIMKKCPDLGLKFLGHDWKIMTNALKFGKFLRTQNTLITLGRGGISSAPEFMKSEENKTIEKFLPLFEFSKYFTKSFLLNDQVGLIQKLILSLKLIKLNLHLSLMKIINILRYNNTPHKKIGPAYKKENV